ncbi:MAG: sulfatase [Planctomycetes bacterium]|nr:sulfatase [Planctomycetota bacterium]
MRRTRRAFSITFLPALAALLASCTGESYPPKPEGPPPNIILIVADTVRADHLGCYGHPAKATPAMDKLAREGARFSRTYASAPWTLPSHGTLFTGRPPAIHRLTHASITRRIMDPAEGLAVSKEALLTGRLPTVASILAECGYDTLGVSQNPWVGRATTLDCGFRTFWSLWDRKEERPVPEPESGPDLELHPVTRHVRWWLENGRDRGKPFFIFINYIQPHLPYRPDWPFRRAFVKHEVRDDLLDVSTHNWPGLLFNGKLSDDDIACLRELYLAEVAQVDAAIGELRGIFEERGLMDGSAWIVTSDHGECIGHHGFLDHQYNVYEDLLRVPLVIRYPAAVQAGRLIDGTAELADILPTILGWIGRPERRRALSLEGMDLFWDVPERGAARTVIASYDANRIQRDDLETMVSPDVFARLDRSHRAIIRGGRKLILSSDGSKESYDLRADPGETRRDADPKAGDLEEILRATLSRWGDRAFGSAPRREGS